MEYFINAIFPKLSKMMSHFQAGNWTWIMDGLKELCLVIYNFM